MSFDELKQELHEKIRRRLCICNLMAACLVLLAEIVIAYFFYSSRFITNLLDYLEIRVFIPSGLSFGSLILFFLFNRNKKSSDFTKNLFTVFSIFTLCSIVAIFHNYYSLMLLAMIVPFFMSATFGDRRILNIISISTIPVAIIAFYVNYTEKSLAVDNLYRMTTLISCSFFLVIGYVASNLFLRMQQTQMDYLSFSNQNERELIERLKLDPLTELNNRNSLKEILAEAIKNFTFGNDLYYLIMIDVDRFKSINDTYGHLKGDIVLKRLSHVIKKHLVDGDYGFRFGGEEFLILLKTKPSENVESVYEEIKKLGEEFSSTEYDFCAGTKITFSAGICSCENAHEVDDWIKKADEAMYTSKIEGRNRITVYNK